MINNRATLLFWGSIVVVFVGLVAAFEMMSSEPSLRLENATLNVDAGGNWRCVVINGNYYIALIQDDKIDVMYERPHFGKNCNYIKRRRDEKDG